MKTKEKMYVIKVQEVSEKETFKVKARPIRITWMTVGFTIAGAIFTVLHFLR